MTDKIRKSLKDKAYYEKNKKKILAKRRARYADDEEFRLAMNCNTALGLLGEDVGLLDRLKEYVLAWESQSDKA